MRSRGAKRARFLDSKADARQLFDDFVSHVHASGGDVELPADPLEFSHTHCMPSDQPWFSKVGVDPGVIDFANASSAAFNLGGKRVCTYTDNSDAHRRACGVPRHKRSQERRARAIQGVLAVVGSTLARLR